MCDSVLAFQLNKDEFMVVINFVLENYTTSIFIIEDGFTISADTLEQSVDYDWGRLEPIRA